MVRKPGMPDRDEKAGTGSDPGQEHLPVLPRPGTTTPRAHRHAELGLAAGVGLLIALLAALWVLDNRGGDSSSPTASDAISEQRAGGQGGAGDDAGSPGGDTGSAPSDGGSSSDDTSGSESGGTSEGGTTSGGESGDGAGTSSEPGRTGERPDGTGPDSSSGGAGGGGGRRGPRTTEATDNAATVTNTVSPAANPSLMTFRVLICPTNDCSTATTDVAGSPFNLNTGSHVFGGLSFNQRYRLIGTPPAPGWTISISGCSGTFDQTISGNHVNFTLDNSEEDLPYIDCHFTSTAANGSVEITKFTAPAGGTGPFPITLTGPPPIGTVTHNFTAGEQFTINNLPTVPGYSVTENLGTLPYTKFINCGEGVNPNNFTPAPGATMFCVVTNVHNGTLNVTKSTVPPGGTGAFVVNVHGPNTFFRSGTLTNDGGHATFSLPIGNGYSITEDLGGLPYSLGQINCGGVINPTNFNVTQGQNIDCTITNNANPGSLTVNKATTPANGPGQFPVALTGPNSFNQSQTINGGGGSVTFSNVPAGANYSLTENTTGLPYTLTGINCGGAGPSTGFTVAPGGHVTCTVSNTAHPGSVTVTKSTTPAGGTQQFPVVLTGPNAFSSNQTINGDGAQVQFTNVPVGTGYSLTETLGSLPYTLTGIDCGSAGPSTGFTVAPGANVSCTVSNQANPGTVIVKKTTSPTGGSGPFPVTLAGPNQFSQSQSIATDGAQVTFSNVPSGSGYSVTEQLGTLPYTLTGIDCDSAGPSTGFTVAPGATVTCTVTNALEPATMKVTKKAEPTAAAHGTAVMFTIKVENTGPVPLTTVNVTDDLPDTLAFVKATPSQGTCSGTGNVTCSLGQTVVGADATVKVKTRLKSSATGEVVNEADVAATAPSDPDINGQDSATVQVMSSPTTTTTSTTSPTSSTTSVAPTTASGGGTSGGSTSGGSASGGSTSAAGVLPVTGSWPAMLAKSAAWLIGLGTLAWLGTRRWRRRRTLNLAPGATTGDIDGLTPHA